MKNNRKISQYNFWIDILKAGSGSKRQKQSMAVLVDKWLDEGVFIDGINEETFSSAYNSIQKHRKKRALIIKASLSVVVIIAVVVGAYFLRERYVATQTAKQEATQAAFLNQAKYTQQAEDSFHATETIESAIVAESVVIPIATLMPTSSADFTGEITTPEFQTSAVDSPADNTMYSASCDNEDYCNWNIDNVQPNTTYALFLRNPKFSSAEEAVIINSFVISSHDIPKQENLYQIQLCEQEFCYLGLDKADDFGRFTVTGSATFAVENVGSTNLDLLIIPLDLQEIDSSLITEVLRIVKPDEQNYLCRDSECVVVGKASPSYPIDNGSKLELYVPNNGLDIVLYLSKPDPNNPETYQNPTKVNLANSGFGCWEIDGGLDSRSVFYLSSISDINILNKVIILTSSSKQ